MKQQLKYLSLCFLAVGLWSCDDDEALIDTREVGANAVLVDRNISVLDQNEDVTIELFTNNVEFESITIEDGDGNVLTTASIGDGTATFSTSELGDFKFGDDNDEVTGTYDLRIVSMLSSGEVLNDPASINVDHAIELSEVDEITYLDPTSDEDETVLGYSVSTFNAPIDDFMLEWKKNEAGTYVEADDITLSPEEGEIDLAKLDYEAYDLAPGDTLYYRFTATSGSFQDQVVTSVVVVPQMFNSSESATISNDATASQFSFTTGENYAEGSSEGEITFTEVEGFEVVNDALISFVEVTEEDFFSTVDLMDAREAFEDGTPVTSVPNVEAGDVFVYKTTRTVEGEEVVVYGIIKVGDVTVVNGTAVSFEIEYKEGTIVE
ncbi:hypothetical protein V5739_10730 [Salinimicrobium sp. TIG7-5_MAKvit]|uniref:hypothetical protein n=1 Tax=Salinimicrobium sp. TIG7-5_MAKvit TaxID=3121289 RepID=UPI003C6E4C2E